MNIILEGLMLKLKLQSFGQLMQRTNLIEKTLVLEKIEGKRRRKWQRMRQLDNITDSMNMHLCKLWSYSGGQRRLVCLEFMGLQRVRYNLASEQR